MKKGNIYEGVVKKVDLKNKKMVIKIIPGLI